MQTIRSGKYFIFRSEAFFLALGIGRKLQYINAYNYYHNKLNLFVWMHARSYIRTYRLTISALLYPNSIRTISPFSVAASGSG